jgi:hypothetical protein
MINIVVEARLTDITPGEAQNICLLGRTIHVADTSSLILLK